MTTPARRTPGRRLPPLAAGLWILFLLWTVLVELVWRLRIGEAELHLLPSETGAPLSPWQGALVALLKWIDPTWAVLAAVNAYFFTAAREGLEVARRWAGVILATVLLIAWVSAKTAWPLGPVRYTALLGPRIGPVPMGLPLLWLAVLLGARDLALRLRPALSQAALAVGVGVLGLLFEIALEPLAAKERVFWLWPPGSLPTHAHAPVQSYATWFIVAALLAYFLREKRVATTAPPATRSPAAVYVVLLTVLLLANLTAGR
ncbi:MAG TPA: carotenoid biosynthesis protein [Chthoniobacteraceae bacterium]|jgi:hypothetical protein|nr:carotenoid biosynthesis protein [Chthoniobacteraceae bacterium]